MPTYEQMYKERHGDKYRHGPLSERCADVFDEAFYYPLYRTLDLTLGEISRSDRISKVDSMLQNLVQTMEPIASVTGILRAYTDWKVQAESVQKKTQEDIWTQFVTSTERLYDELFQRDHCVPTDTPIIRDIVSKAMQGCPFEHLRRQMMQILQTKDAPGRPAAPVNHKLPPQKRRAM